MTNPKAISTNLINMKEYVGTITEEGKEISFRDFLRGMEGFDDVCGSIMAIAAEGQLSWVDVEDYLCPIVEKLLVDAVEVDYEIYFELMVTIEQAYNKHISRRVDRELQEAEDLPFHYIDVKSDGADLAERFERIATHIRNGCTLERVEDKVDQDGHYYFTLIKPGSEQ